MIICDKTTLDDRTVNFYSSWWHSNRNISKHLDMSHFWLQSLSVWLEATSEIHCGQVLSSRCDAIWQSAGINGGLTTRHCVQWYWSKFTLILLIKGKNNTEQIHDLKGRRDKRFDKDFDLVILRWNTWASDCLMWPLSRCCCLQTDLHKCGADWQPYQGPKSEAALWDECARGGRSVWLVVNAHKRWPLPCHVPPKSTYEKWLTDQNMLSSPN